MLESTARLVSACAIASCWAFFALACAILTPSKSFSQRSLIGCVLAAWVATAIFLVLGYLRWVSLPSLLFSAGGAALAVGRVMQRRVPDWARQVGAWARLLRELPRRIGPLATAMLAVLGVSYAVLGAAGAVSPLLGWDSLHYHLVHVAQWAQEGGFVPQPGVDAWEYYEHFPIGGEILWAWLCIPTRDTTLLGLAGIAVTGLAGLATYVAARSLSSSVPGQVEVAPGRAVLAGCVVLSPPAVAMFATNGYVDNATFSFAAAGFALLLAAMRSPAPNVVPWIALSFAAFGLAIGVKTTAIGFAALGAVCALVLLLARRAGARRIVGSALLAIPGLLIAVPRLVETWIRRGSPMYPFPLKLGKWVISAGESELVALLTARYADKRLEAAKSELFQLLFVRSVRPDWPHVNFGWGGAALLLAGAIGLGFWLTRRPKDLRVWLFLALICTALPYFSGPNTLGYRIYWWWIIARFMLGALLALVLLASVVPGRWVDYVFAGCSVGGAAYALGSGMCSYRWIGAASVLFSATCIGGLSWIIRRSGYPKLATGLILSGALGLASLLLMLRKELAYIVLAGALRGQCYEGHPLTHAVLFARPVWDALADAPPRRIALVSGFEGVGHNVFRYPLLGRRWQHRVVYVAPSADGKLRGHPDIYGLRDRPALSFEAWLSRLKQQRVTHVVLVPPFNVEEYRWVFEHKRHFVLEQRGEKDYAFLFRVVP
ncbi:MAG TPA: hypothetical protein VFQ61_28760 [Polyangiaceae bacterium]|nr:hypothetical protein [Polyangiaceae bacterium]